MLDNVVPSGLNPSKTNGQFISQQFLSLNITLPRFRHK